MSQQNKVIIISILAVLIIGGYYYMTKNEPSVEREENQTQPTVRFLSYNNIRQ